MNTTFNDQMTTQIQEQLNAGSAASKLNTLRNRSLIAAVGVAAVAGAAFYFRNELMNLIGYQRIHVMPHIQANLPIAKNLKTVSDMDGNYDMDGVSFDSEGVVVGSDQQFQTEAQTVS